jgi:peptidoglycan/LPS O-acetylase OafA/YrhL
MILAGVIAFSGPVLLLANHYLLPALRGQEAQMFHTRIDALMMGCFAAYLLDSPAWRGRIRKIPVGPILLASALFVLAVVPYARLCFRTHSLAGIAVALVMPTLSAVAIAAAILTLVAGKAGPIHALFNQPAVAHIGKLSYGLYIWQQLFLYSVPSPLSFAWRIPAIYAVSLCSFNFVEKPFLKLRKKFRRVPE